MAENHAQNGVQNSTNGHPNSPSAQEVKKSESKPRGPPGPNKFKIYAKPLPLETYPLPSFQPHNPLSFLPVVYVVIRDFFFGPSSHPSSRYQSYFSKRTRSVHVTDVATIRVLWEMGFFGKGTLSRSEPNWLDFERRRLGIVAFETAEERTGRRRKEREEFKRERARIEREIVQEQREKEASGATHATEPSSIVSSAAETATIAGTKAREVLAERQANKAVVERPTKNEIPPATHTSATSEPENQEHLQLAPEEAFFLTYALGVLDIQMISSTGSTWDILQVFRQNSTFPPTLSSILPPDDSFILHYVVYHHFRSLGWVVRDGIKFAVDYMLYDRGPVFNHAAFAVIIIPSYADPYWSSSPARKQEVAKTMAKYTWHWFHGVNRVQNQVVKTLVLVYVDVPSPEKQRQAIERQDIGRLLRSYTVREFCIKRWSANRNRQS